MLRSIQKCARLHEETASSQEENPTLSRSCFGGPITYAGCSPSLNNCKTCVVVEDPSVVWHTFNKPVGPRTQVREEGVKRGSVEGRGKQQLRGGAWKIRSVSGVETGYTLEAWP